MKHQGNRRAAERGAALVLVAVSLLAMLALVGLALDAGQLYVNKQRAQAAADAAAMAGIMDVYNGTGDGAATAIAYAHNNGFNTPADTITPSYPDCSTLDWCSGHVSLSTVDNPNLLQVRIERQVNTTLLRVLGVTTSTVNAVATAAVAVNPSPVPILVLHPTMAGSFSKNGTNVITICGGPQRSIQVNSTSTASISIAGKSGTVDLSHAGPLDSGDCSSGTGGDFANVGSQNPYPGTILLGTRPGEYLSPASIIEDPLLSVPAPAQPAAAPAPVSYTKAADLAAHGCPVSCTVYSPGYYDGTTRRLDNVSGFSVFRPGIYWINRRGFQLGSNTIVRMATAVADQIDLVTGTGWTDQMLIYNNGADPFSISANSGKLPGNNTYPTPNCPGGGNCLQGSPMLSTYRGILFFQNRATAATVHHDLQGGGGLTLRGTIYLTHTAAGINADGTYQSLSLQGNPGSTTRVEGEIIVDALSMGGNSGVTMNLTSSPVFDVRQAALVQ